MATKRFKPSAPVKLADASAERARQNADERIRELQAVPIVAGKLLKRVFLADDTITPVPHGMGRPVSTFVSPPVRANGGSGTNPRILRLPDNGDADPNQYVALYSEGWGTNGVYVDIWVF